MRQIRRYGERVFRTARIDDGGQGKFERLGDPRQLKPSARSRRASSRRKTRLPNENYDATPPVHATHIARSTSIASFYIVADEAFPHHVTRIADRIAERLGSLCTTSLAIKTGMRNQHRAGQNSLAFPADRSDESSCVERAEKDESTEHDEH